MMNDVGRKNITRKDKINNKAVTLCRRLVQEKEVLVSQVEKLANKLTVQQQNLIKLQTNAKVFKRYANYKNVDTLSVICM